MQPQREVRESGSGIEKQPDLSAGPSDQNLLRGVEIEVARAGLLPIREAGGRAIEQPLIPGFERRWRQWRNQMFGHATCRATPESIGLGEPREGNNAGPAT